MEQFARRPDELSSEGPMNINWRNWKQSFEIFLKASDSNKRSDDVKACLLMNLIGPVGLQAFQKFSFDEESDSENLEILLKKFDDYFDPQKSEAHERFVFFTSTKKKTETYEQYVTDMRVKARTCNFGTLADSLIRDKIILDVKDKMLKKHLLNEPDLTLSQTIIMCEAFERTAEKVAELCDSKKTKTKPQPKAPAAAQAAEPSPKSETPNQQKLEQQFKKPCWKCGQRHEMKACPAYGKKCAKCHGMNHYTQNCANNPKSVVRNNTSEKPHTSGKKVAPGPFAQIPSASDAWEMIEAIKRDVTKNVAIRNLPNNFTKK